ncbi:MAG: zinc-binding dehydrogenase [Myxococcota bacterium]
MKAYIARQYGADAQLELADVPTPEPRPGEILIRVEATSLNPIDNKQLRHDLGINPELPAILHGDVAGVVDHVGPGVERFEVGDRVYACAGGFRGTAGALAELMPADAKLVAHRPTSLSAAQAAALPLVALTAWESLVDGAKLQPAEHVLIHGGTGGLGHVALQIAKAHGARVAVTVSTEAKAEIARRLGADDIIFYRSESVDDYVRRFTDGRGFDVVYDTLSGANFERSLQAVRIRGRVATVFTGTDSTTLDLTQAFVRALTVYAQNMSIPLITGEGREHHGEILGKVAELVDAGKLEPLVDPHRFDFSQANEAHAFFEANEHVGKIVLEAGGWA